MLKSAGTVNYINKLIYRKLLICFAFLLILLPISLRGQEMTSSNLLDNISRPNIVWINAEDISPAFGCYGDGNAITPNIDRIASNGLVFKKVFSTAPICSPSRSSFISGMHSTTLGSQHLRSEINRPENIKVLPELLNNEGYFTSILGKTDYNFDSAKIWDYWEEDEKPWRKRAKGQPFFSTFTYGFSHEGRGNDYSKYLEMRNNIPKELLHDSLSVKPPIYFPDTPDFRNLWTRYYDLVTLFDRKVGEIVQNLEDDGLLDNTVIFIFSDHGFGMPRYKRWLYNSGIHVPLVVYVPKNIKLGNTIKDITNGIISFVDFAPTVLSLANVKKPKYIQGRVFLGKNSEIESEPKVVYASRSRADNTYDMSRAVRSDRYIYIRNFMPYMPYIQKGKIFSNEKESFRLLRESRDINGLSEQAEAMFQKKEVEELYDLRNDPYELRNIVNKPQYRSVLKRMRSHLKKQAVTTRDLGFLHETEFHRRSKNSTPFYVGLANLNITRLFDAADMVGKGTEHDFIELLNSADPGIRYWGLIGLRNLPKISLRALAEVTKLLNDVSSANQMQSAEIVLKINYNDSAITVLKDYLISKNKVNSLMAARTLELLGEKSWALLPEIHQVLDRYSAPLGSKFPYTDYDYAAFISWSLEAIIEELESAEIKKI